MANSLSPNFIELLYHSTQMPHVATIPTLAWNDAASPGGAGTFETWSGVDVDAFDMVEQLAIAMTAFYNSFVTIDGFTVYSLPVDPGPAYPVASGSFTALVGTNPSASWWAAVQTTVIARSTLFGICKLVMLDSVSGDNFAPELTQSAAMLALTGPWFSLANGWSARDNGRPKTFIKATQTLNEKLRKTYRFD